MTLSGCAAEIGEESMFSFSTMVLFLWTGLCMFYTWWMFRSSSWQSMDQFMPAPVTHRASQDPHNMDESQVSLEGLLFLTTRRVVKRLERAVGARDEGRARKYVR